MLMRRGWGAVMATVALLSACAPLTVGQIPARWQMDGNGQMSVEQSSTGARNYFSSNDRIDALILRPRKAIEVVKNMELIFRQNLLLEGGFYSKGGLTETFNFEHLGIFNKEGMDGVKSGVSIIGALSRKIFPFVKIAGTNSVVPGASVVGGISVYGNGQIMASVNLSMRRSEFDFDTAMSIFRGGFLRDDNRRRYSHPERVPKPTAAHGNESWTYEEEVEGVKKSVRLSFDPAGYLDSIIVKIDSGERYVAE